MVLLHSLEMVNGVGAEIIFIHFPILLWSSNVKTRRYSNLSLQESGNIYNNRNQQVPFLLL